MTRRPLPLLAIGAAAALAIAGCGSSNNDGGSTGSTGSAASSSGGNAYGGTTGATTAAAPASGGAATISTRKTNLGTILVDGQGRTLYLWVADKGDKSVCNGGCAQAWPPVLTNGMPKAKNGVSSAKLGTTMRADGKTEVTYKGHPLYTFVEDNAPGDTTGQGSDGFGAKWWVVGTNGNAITTAA